MGKEAIGSGETEGRSNGQAIGSTSTTSTSGGRGRRPARTGKSDQETYQIPLVEGQPKIVAVEVPGNDKEEKEDKPKKRGRPAGTAKKKPAAKPQGQADYLQLKVLLITISGIVAGKAQAAEFMLTDQEAEQIAKPLANIMAKNDGVAAISNEYADHIALVFAALTIFVPKYFAWRAKNPKKQKGGVNNVQSIRNDQQRGSGSPAGQQYQSGTTNGSSKPANRSIANPSAIRNDTQAFNGSIADIMPAIAGI